MTSIYEPIFDEDSVRYGFRYRRARLGYQVGCERLGLSLWELPAGSGGHYHYHFANEELLVALSGRSSLRTPGGWRDLDEGELAVFPRGARGAHCVANRGEEAVRLLFLSEMRGPEVVIYPDQDSVGALEKLSSPERGGFAAWLRLEAAFERHDDSEAAPEASPGATAGRANLLAPAFDEERELEGFHVRRARLGRQAGSERLGASLYELPPGQAAWPYHYHLSNEELLVVIAGRPSLRTPEGERKLGPGEVLPFPVGREGAHLLRNRSQAPVRALVVSQMRSPEVALYPDSGKVGVLENAPGTVDVPGELEAWLPLDRGVEYWEGE